MIDTSSIPASKGKKETQHEDGSTEDIISSILEIDAESGKEMCNFAQQFKDGLNGLKRLFKFVRDEIKYKEDGFKEQNIKTPPALWALKYGDCKSKTIFINSVLYCLGIPYIIRFTRFDRESTEMRHVYTIAYLNGRPIILDTVYKKFGKEKPYSYKRDFKPMTKINKISGIGDCDTLSPATRIKSQVGMPVSLISLSTPPNMSNQANTNASVRKRLKVWDNKDPESRRNIGESSVNAAANRLKRSFTSFEASRYVSQMDTPVRIALTIQGVAVRAPRERAAGQPGGYFPNR